MNTEKKLYQWDTGQKLTGCTGLYVDFPIGNEVYRVETANGMCIIPDELLQTSGSHKVYECMTNNTIRSFAFSVIPRPKPPEYVFTPTERLTFEGLVQKVDDAVADMIRRAESGEFDGYTPVKGADYFTTEEIQQIQNEVSSGAIGDFKSVVDTETDKFNANATEKVNAYNQNDSEKTASYNANATKKLNAYNANANNRVAEFDSHTEQIQTDISELKSDLTNVIDNKINDEHSVLFLTLNVYNTSAVGDVVGEPTSSSNFKGQVIPVDKGDTFIISSTGGSSYRAWAFTDDNKVILSNAEYNQTVTNLKITAPENGFLYAHFKNEFEAKLIKIYSRTDGLGRTEVSILNISKCVYNTQNIGSTVGNTEFSPNFKGQVIPVNKNDVFYITGTGGYTYRLWAFTDENGTVIENADSGAIEENKCIVAKQDGYLYVTFKNNTPTALIKEMSYVDYNNLVIQTIKEKSNAQNCLYGKKYVATGDSYTAWSDATYLDGKYITETVTYDREIRIRNDMNGLNDGLSGTTMALAKSSVAEKETIDINAFSNTRYTAIPEDTDILTIAFGINDSSLCDLGQLGDTENTTFYGAWDKVLKYYAENRPNMKIGIICFQRSNNDFYQAVKEIAKYYGIPLLDFYGGEDTPMYVDGKAYPVDENIKAMRKAYWGGHAHESETIETFRGKKYKTIVSDGNPGHPGYKAHIDESTIIETFLRSL